MKKEVTSAEGSYPVSVTQRQGNSVVDLIHSHSELLPVHQQRVIDCTRTARSMYYISLIDLSLCAKMLCAKQIGVLGNAAGEECGTV